MLKVMIKNWFLILLLTLGMVSANCAPSKFLKKGQAGEEKQVDQTEGKVAILQIELPKTNYAVGEAIPVTLKLKLGKFDLLVPKDTVKGVIAFSSLILKTDAGEEVKPTRAFGIAAAPKTIYHKREPVKCILGVELKAHSETSVSLEDLSNYYPLTKPGRYSLQALKELKVYKKVLIEKSPQIQQIEENIASIRSDPNLPASAKQDAINSLQAELQLYQSEEGAERKFLPLNSYRGSTKLQSNVIEFTIQ